MGKKIENSDLGRVKLETGTVYQTKRGGTYYFRYQVRQERKCVSLQTCNQEDAIQKAKEIIPTVKATNLEVIAAHVKVARKLAQQARSLPLSRIWEVYSQHPQRALPATVREHLNYEATLNEFLEFLQRKVSEFSHITERHAIQFSEHLKNTEISVSTHNRKIIRLRKIFDTLQEYREGKNPFEEPVLRRKPREEQDNVVRRMAFSREQEDAILKVLDDPAHRIMNKPEIRTIFYIGMYTGQRLKDCVLMQWQNIDLEHRRIWVKQFKTGKEVSIPIAPPLLAVLQEALTRRTDGYVNPNVAVRYKKTDKQGKCIGDGLVNIDVMRVIRWTGVETSLAVPGRKKKITVFGFHSLRHSFASFCAEAGVPKAVVVSILGADSSILDRFYTHVGEDAQAAAINAISGTSTQSDREKIKEALTYIQSLSMTSPEVDRIYEILSPH